jgi:N-acetylmuramoyl-L-alanine amidase
MCRGGGVLGVSAAESPTADGETSLVRALGLKIGRIVIDAGHGGHDSGTLGADGIEEKDVVLDVALRLGKLLHDRLGAEIVYTRGRHVYPAGDADGDCEQGAGGPVYFVHANSSPDASARGVEDVLPELHERPGGDEGGGARECGFDQSVHELSDLVKKIALKDKIDESRELAADVEASCMRG